MKTTKLYLLALALAAQVLNVPVLEPAQAASWVMTSPLSNARAAHTATLLRDGKVLVAGGGINNSDFSSTELYDPVAGKWTATGPLRTARAGHEATLLSNGKVLVAGVSGTWATSNTANTNRTSHTATLLSDGTVLVTGGMGDSRPDFTRHHSSTELYLPAAERGRR